MIKWSERSGNTSDVVFHVIGGFLGAILIIVGIPSILIGGLHLLRQIIRFLGS